MRNKILFWILALGWAMVGRDGARGQQLQPVVSQQADCGKFVQPAITTAGTFNSQTIDNRSAACDGFVVTYSPQGFATVSVELRSANVTSTGTAGAFGTFAGTVTAGFVNPAVSTSCTTATSCEIRATGYFPYVRVQITTTGTGYLVAEVHGFKTNPNSGGSGGGSGCPGTVGTPCVVVGPAATGAALNGAPVNTGTSDGVRVVQPFICTQSTFVNLSGSGDTQIIALTGGQSIHICDVYFSTTAVEDIKLTTGTGANCGTGTADFSPLYKSVQSGRLSYNPGAKTAPVGNALCFNQSAVQANGVEVTFVKF